MMRARIARAYAIVTAQTFGFWPIMARPSAPWQMRLKAWRMFARAMFYREGP